MNATGFYCSNRIGLVVALALAMLVLPATSYAASYTFTNIADDTGDFLFFGVFPSINSSGTVAFFAALDAGGSGIYTGNGGPTSTIADTTGLFSAFGGTPSINSSGVIAFQASLDAGGSGIYTGNGGSPTTIADTTGSFLSFGIAPAINDSGSVAFNANHTVLGQGIYSGNGGPATTIDAPAPSLSSSSINSAGDIVFHDATTLYVGNGGPLTPLVSTSGLVASFGYGDGPSINDSGSVAFYATLDDSSEGIFTTSGGPTTTIADNSAAFISFGEPAINNNGIVAFQASLNDFSSVGIFTGPDSVADKVIKTGDSLFGSTVSQVTFLRGLNSGGDIAFYYQLENEVTGIAVADLILGDTDGDGDVDFDDFLAVQNFFGGSGPNSPGDADNDGDCDFDDFLAVQNFFGTGVPGIESPGIAIPGSSLTFVPEPASFSLLALVGLTLMRRKH